MSKYLNAEINRQSILNFLNENPHSSTTAISSAIGMKVGDVKNLILRMMDENEIDRTGKCKHILYHAIATTTISADELMARVKVFKAEKQADRTTEKRHKSGHGVYVHTPGENPIRNQGGQGALRSRVFVGSTAGML